MGDNRLGTNVVAQIGILVRDIERTSAAYADFLGVETPQWFWTGDYDAAKTEYEGKPSDARAKLAFFEMGNVQIELIEPDETPSVWRDHLDRNGEGPHHIAFVVDGMRHKLEWLDRNRMPLLQKGEYTGGRYAYVDTAESLKVLVELLEND